MREHEFSVAVIKDKAEVTLANCKGLKRNRVLRQLTVKQIVFMSKQILFLVKEIERGK